MTVKVTYENGVFKLKTPVTLPEGTEGDVTVTGDSSSPALPSEGWRDFEAVKSRVKAISKRSKNTGTTEAVARNHDKYLYGKGHGL